MRIDDLEFRCASADSSGVDEVPEWRDWTGQETTPDQRRIEDVLASEGVHGSVLLHVGVGNSGLAIRFHDEARHIDGITIQTAEYRRAVALGIPNYDPALLSKYSSDLVRRFRHRYDFIIDNNPTTFSCCRWHLATMLASYAWLLRPGGVLLTDKVGLSWSSSPNDSRWGLTASEWWALGAGYGLARVRYTDFVSGLRKGSPLETAAHLMRSLTRVVRALPEPAERP